MCLLLVPLQLALQHVLHIQATCRPRILPAVCFAALYLLTLM
jgi:hypothetical protein